MSRYRRPSSNGSSIIVNQIPPRPTGPKRHLVEQVTGKPMPKVGQTQAPVVYREGSGMRATLLAALVAVCMYALTVAVGVGLEFLFYAIYGGEPFGSGFIGGAIAGIFTAGLTAGVTYEELSK